MTRWQPGDRCWIAVHRDRHETRIEAGGELDYASRDRIRQAVVDALAEPAAPDLVIDLREVTFIDTMAMQAAVVSASEVARDAGIRSKVLASDVVRRVLEISGLNELLG